MSQIELFLLGKSRVKKADGLVRSLSDSQPSLLFIYLATTNQEHHASELNEVFQKQLNKIRYELGRESKKLTGLAFEDLFLREINDRNQTLSLKIKSGQFNADIVEFCELLQYWSQDEDKWTKSGLLQLEKAINLYNGSFAENFKPTFTNYNTWLKRERNTYRHLAAWAMLQLMFFAWSKGSLTQANNFGHQWLEKEPECHLWTGWITYFLMCIAYWGKQSDSALAIYEDYQASLKRQQVENRHNRDLKHWEQIDILVQQIQENNVLSPPMTINEWQELQEIIGIEIPPSLYLDDSLASVSTEHGKASEEVFVPQKSIPDASFKQATRNRDAILQQMRNFWVEGYLEPSLAGVPNIDLQMRAEPGHVAGLGGLFPDLDDAPAISYSFQELGSQFESYTRKLLILGEPGSGKTTALLYLTRYLLQKAEADMNQPIPIIFSLSSWNQENDNLDDWLIEELNSKYHIPHKIATQWIETDALVLMFDGLDEVDSGQQEQCLLAINSFRARHGLVDIVVSCRKEDYKRIESKISLSGTLVMQSLNDGQIETFLDEAEGITTGMMHFIEDNPLMQDLFRSPLVLNLMVRAFHKDESGRSYEDVIVSDEHLFTHYVTRMYQRRSGEKSYSLDETIYYLRQLAQHMEAEQVLHIELLQPSWLSKRNQEIFHHAMWIGSGIIASVFSVMASLIGAVSTGNIPETRLLETPLMWLPFMWIFFSRYQLWRRPIANFIPGITGMIGTFLHFALVNGNMDNIVFDMSSAFIRYSSLSFIGSIMFTLLQNRTDRIMPSEKLDFSLQTANWRGILAGFFGGFTLNYLYIDPLDAFTRGGISGMAMSGLLMGITVFLITGFTSSDVPHRIIPNQGIRASSNNALKVSLFGFLFGIAIFAGLLFTTEIDFAMWQGIVLGLFVMYPIWFIYGGLAVQQHYLLRFMLAQERVLPLKLQEFLDFADSLILMRRIGGGYTFIHKSLQEYFAEQVENDMD